MLPRNNGISKRMSENRERVIGIMANVDDVERILTPEQREKLGRSLKRIYKNCQWLLNR